MRSPIIVRREERDRPGLIELVVLGVALVLTYWTPGIGVAAGIVWLAWWVLVMVR
jgi:hypothetical protein